MALGAYIADPSLGPFYATPHLWRTDAKRRKLGPVIASHPTRATVTFNEDRLHKRDLRVEVVNPDDLKPLVDYLYAELRVTDARGDTRTYPMGHFLVTDREITTDKTIRTGIIQAWDATRALSDTTMPYGATLLAGSDPGASAAELLREHGVPDDMLDIPEAGFLTGTPVTWDPGDTLLDVVNDILNIGDMYTLWTTGDGRFRSRKYEDIAEAAPVAHYGSESGAYIVPPVIERPDYGRIRNRVTVRKTRPDRAPTHATAEVTDQTSPIHPMNLAAARGTNYPVYLSETVDDPDIADYEEGDIAGKIAAIIQAQFKARALLSEKASYYQPLTIQTLVDDVLDGHQTIGLDLTHEGERYYRGKWRQRGWTIQMEGSSAIAQRDVFRTEGWK